LCYREVVYADTVKRRDYSSQDVIQPCVLCGVFYSHHFLYVFHHAHRLLVTLWARTDVAHWRVAYAMATAAIVGVALQARQCTDERGKVAIRRVEQMQRIAQCRTLPYTGQGSYLVDSV